MPTKHVAMSEKQQEQLRKAVHAICKEHNTGVTADLDSRLSYREKDEKNPKAASWDAYSRFLLDDGHTVYVSLRTMKASYSEKVDKFAQAKVEKREAKKAKAAERKAAKEAKAAAKAKPADDVKVLTDADVDRMSESEAKKVLGGKKATPKAKRAVVKKKGLHGRKAEPSTEAAPVQE
jgi:hypothetical protein